MGVRGTRTLFFNDVTLAAASLPQDVFGYFLASRTQGYVFPIVNSEGALCLGGEVGRYVGPGIATRTRRSRRTSLAPLA